MVLTCTLGRLEHWFVDGEDLFSGHHAPGDDPVMTPDALARGERYDIIFLDHDAKDELGRVSRGNAWQSLVNEHLSSSITVLFIKAYLY